MASTHKAVEDWAIDAEFLENVVHAERSVHVAFHY